MQIISQETFLQAEQEGHLFLDHQFSMIQCINDWRIKIFDSFNLPMSQYIPRLQLDIQVIKRSLINPENKFKVSFTLGQISVMDILRMNFKSCQKRLKSFLQSSKDNLSFNLVQDLMKNTQTLREYFSYDKNIELFQSNNLINSSNCCKEINNQDEEEEDQSIHQEFNLQENNTFNSQIIDKSDNKNNTNGLEIINFEQQQNENSLEFDEQNQHHNNNNGNSPHSQELCNFFDLDYSLPQNTNSQYNPQHFTLLE